MGKDKSKKKGKAPKGSTTHSSTLSKKERKALEARAADIEAALAEKVERKAAKKLAKRAAKAAAAEAADAAAAKPTKPVKDKSQSAKTKTLAAADEVERKAGNDATKIEAATARAAASEAGHDETDEQIKARVKQKREARQALEESADKVDRDDHGAVQQYNEALAALGGGRFLTSTQEVADEAARLAGGDDGRVASNDRKKAARAPEPIADEVEAAERQALEDAKTKPKGKKAAEKLSVTMADGETLTTPDESEQVAEEVETEQGRVFAVGDAEAPAERPTFGKPSEAPKDDFEVNGNGQYKVKRKSDGKIVGFTRVTTYIKNLEDTSNLTKWKMRLMLEGIAANDTDADMNDPVVARVADLVHRRDVQIAKARKADRKGKLERGELATYVNGAWKEYKDALNALAETMLDLGGVHEAATKGTDIHALCELYDREGIDAVGDLLTEGKITRSDLLDVEAYAEAIKRAGIKILPDLIERVVVNDELKVAGRLDRGALFKFPGTGRAVRCALDLKTGRIDLGAGTIAQQLEMYASAEGYDLNTHERTDLKLSRTKGLVVHLPAGTGRAAIHVVDLSLGRKGNRLSGEVRAWRNEGKHAIDTSVDLTTAAVES